MPAGSPAGHRSGGRRVVVEHVMGTAISVDARDAAASPRHLDQFFSLLRDVDRRFSPYRQDSEVSRLADGRLARRDVSASLQEVLLLCESVRLQSGGAFDIAGHHPQGRIDPSGLVKGWAIDRGAALLSAAGWNNFCINAGGDVVARGQPQQGRPWRIGIRHPVEEDRVAAVVLLHDMAMATSGAYERGDHIIDPATGGAPRELLSISVIGPDLTLCDAYATAAFVKGRDGVAWIAGLPGYAAFAATSAHRALWTHACERVLAPDLDMKGGADPAAPRTGNW